DGRTAGPKDDSLSHVLCRDSLVRPGKHGKVEIPSLGCCSLRNGTQHDRPARAVYAGARCRGRLHEALEAMAFGSASLFDGMDKAGDVDQVIAPTGGPSRNVHCECRDMKLAFERQRESGGSLDRSVCDRFG